jgi:hypothetical protein
MTTTAATTRTTRTNYIHRHPAAHNGPAIMAQRAHLAGRIAEMRASAKAAAS